MRLKMRKIVFSTIFILTLCYWKIEGRPSQTKPGCWYEGKRYQEAEEVNTSEPCLRCRCTEGSLRCRLRVCPKLPNPVPSGCTTSITSTANRTPGHDACCPELVCGRSNAKSHERNASARRDPAQASERPNNEDSGGCVHEGVRYGPGSAMMASRRCEYCYCISGSRRCLRPRCLLPLAGCIPVYAPYSCCPVAYNCTGSFDDSFPGVVSASSSPGPPLRYGCRVGDRVYEEGEMVRQSGWKGRCDNCFCAMGGVRCVPLSCAPPLQGCIPIVPRGQCCPSTYNCSGTIEVKADQNYASYAFVSKDYAKFRKETNFLGRVREEPSGNSEARAHKSPVDQDETINDEDPDSFDSTLTDTVTSRITEIPDKKFVYQENQSFIDDGETPTTISDTIPPATSLRWSASTKDENEIPTESATIESFPNNRETTTTIDDKTETSVGTNNIETTLKSDLPTSIESVEGGLLETLENASASKIITPSLMATQMGPDTTKNPTSLDRTVHREEETVSLTEVASESPKKKDKNEEDEILTRTSTSTTQITDFQQRQNFSEASSSVIAVKGPTATTSSPSTVLMPDNMYVINVTLRTNVSVGHVQQAGVTINPVRSVPPDIEAILDITIRKKGEEDYEYDYEEPTLPPSLPNLRIIPFVAADALVKQEEDVVSSAHVTGYPLGSGVTPAPPALPALLQPQDLGPTVASSSGVGGGVTPDNFYDIVTQKNRFSPPVETEGGFVPREPSYFDPPYRSTDRNTLIRTGVTVMVPADMTNSHMRNNDEVAGICVFENRNYRHGDLLPSSGHCIICVCYYGEVACSDEKCPPLKMGCRRLNSDKICCGKIICVNDEESPTVVLDRADAIAPPPRAPLPSLDGIVSPDPFRDVIKTKPAPDLPSLIEDMIPYLVEHRITKPPITETTTVTSTISELPTVGNTRPDQEIVEGNENGSKGGENRPCSGGKTSAPLAAVRNDGNQSQGIGSEASRPTSNGALGESSSPDESSIFSLDGLRDLIFSEESKVSVSPEGLLSNPTPTTSTTTSSVRNSPSGTTFQLQSPLTTSMATGNGSTIDSVWKSEESSEAFDQRQSLSSSSIITESSTSATLVTADDIAWIKVEQDPLLEPSVTGSTTALADNEIIGGSGSGLLKLAGCNIYGRMYRVGRIITELSSSCLECRCTEVGVQCKQLKC